MSHENSPKRATSVTEPGCDSALPKLPNELMTVAQVCSEYNIGRTTLYEALSRQSLKAKVVGKRGTRIRRGDIEYWIEHLPDYKPRTGADANERRQF